MKFLLIASCLVFQLVNSLVIESNLVLQPNPVLGTGTIDPIVPAIQITGCTSNDQCAKGTCCVITSPFIMSKRIVAIDSLVFTQDGSCRPYTLENEDCYSVGFGSCGCEPGTTCEKVADLPDQPTLSLPSSKMVIFRPPGVYRCVRK